MFRKSSTLSGPRTSGVEPVLTHKGISTLVLGLSALVLAAVVILQVMPAIAPNVPPRTANPERSAAASTARWNAMAAHYASGLDAAAAASAARYQGLAEYYVARNANLERSRAASTARWNAMATHYTQETMDYDRSTAASSARYQGLADWFAKQPTSEE